MLHVSDGLLNPSTSGRMLPPAPHLPLGHPLQHGVLHARYLPAGSLPQPPLPARLLPTASRPPLMPLGDMPMPGVRRRSARHASLEPSSPCRLSTPLARVISGIDIYYMICIEPSQIVYRYCLIVGHHAHGFL